MTTHVPTRLVSLILLTTVCVVARPRRSAADDLPGNAIFGDTHLLSLHLELSPAAFAALEPQPRFGPPAGGPAEDAHRNTFGVDLPWSRGTLHVDGQAYPDCGIRYKGNYTFLATAGCLHRSLKVDLNRHVKRQRLDGLTMLTLNCGVSDATRLREAVSHAFFRAAGVPAPRTAFAEITLSVAGRYEREYVGVATLVESVDERFLTRHFGGGDGLLLKPEGLAGGPTFLGEEWPAYADRYRPEDEPDERQRRRLVEFARLVSTADDAAFAAGIADHLDVDAFLRFIAANALLANADSYLAFGHNYCLYLAPDRDRFVFIPWDLDLSLATWPAAGTPEQLVRLSIMHPHAGDNPLLDRILAIPAHRDRYLAIIAELGRGCFTETWFLERIDAMERVLREPLALETFAALERGESRGGRFGDSLPPRRFAVERTRSVAAQLAGDEEGFVPRPFPAGFGGPPRRGAAPPTAERAVRPGSP